MILPAPPVRLLVLASALVLDLSFGKLPSRLHPVAGMGTFIRTGVCRVPADGRRRRSGRPSGESGAYRLDGGAEQPG